MQPVWCHGGHRIERRTEGFRHQFEAVQDADGGQHVRRVGTLRSAGLEPAQGAAALEELVQHEFFGTAGQEAVAKFAEHRKVKAGIRQGESEQVFPVNTSPHRLGGLAISEMFVELHNSDECQTPGREARLALQREAGGKVVVLEDRPEGIPQEQVRIAFGEGGTGHTGGFFRHRLQGVRA